MGDRVEDIAELRSEHSGGGLSELADLAGTGTGEDVGDPPVLAVARALLAVGERVNFHECANVLDHAVRQQAMPDLGSLILDDRRWTRRLRAREDGQIVE